MILVAARPASGLGPIVFRSLRDEIATAFRTYDAGLLEAARD
jgi:hypothetical protein